MDHSMMGINRKTLAIVAVLLVGALIAVYLFDVSWSTIGTVALVGFFAWMHMGMHGGHDGMHGGHGDDVRRDEHAGHTVDTARDENAKALAPDGNARGLAPDETAKTVAREESPVLAQ